MASEANDPVRLVEDNETGDGFLIYSTDRGIKVELRFEGETFWLSQKGMAELFGVTVPTVNEHLKGIYSDGEHSEAATIRNFRMVRQEGARKVSRDVQHYNLNAIISVGYRVSSKQGTLFRMGRRTSSSSSPRRASSSTRNGSKTRPTTTASTSMTPSTLLLDRVDADAPDLGLRSWPKDEIRQADALTAKNVLAEPELRELNRLTTILLDIFEDQLELGQLTLMAEAERLLDDQLKRLGRPVRDHGGRASSNDAERHVKAQYKRHDERRRQERKASADAELAELKQTGKTLPKAGRKPKPKGDG